MPSVLWRCWLGGRKGIRPVKNWVVRCWNGYLPGARCRLAYAQLMPLPLTVSCFSKIQIGFTFLVPAHPGRPGKRATKRVCVCVLLHLQNTATSKYYKHTRNVITSAGWQLTPCNPTWHASSCSGEAGRKLLHIGWQLLLCGHFS